MTKARQVYDALNPPPWCREHGLKYAVPEAIYRHPLIEDISYHNDICPRFVFKADLDRADRGEVDINTIPDLWADHPDPEGREYEDLKRFRVYSDAPGVSNPLYEGDDPSEALNAFLSFCSRQNKG
jgi:hypothetical protein